MDGLVDVCLVRVIISSYFNWSWLNPARAVRRRESSEHVKCRLAEVSQAEPHGSEMNHKIFSIESTTHDSKPEKRDQPTRRQVNLNQKMLNQCATNTTSPTGSNSIRKREVNHPALFEPRCSDTFTQSSLRTRIRRRLCGVWREAARVISR